MRGAKSSPPAANTMQIPNIVRLHNRPFLSILLGLVAAAAITLAFVLRFEYTIPRSQVTFLWKGICLVAIVRMLIYRATGLDRGGWRYSSLPDIYKLLMATAAGSVLWAALSVVAIGRGFPRSIYGIEFVLCFVAVGGVRLLVRSYYESHAMTRRTRDRKRVLIYGAGAAGYTLLKEVRANGALGYQVAGFLDDDHHKRGQNLLGVPVLGSGRSAPLIVERFRRRGARIDEIVIAMPSASGRAMNEALSNCRSAGVACKTIPGVGELLSGKVLTSQIRDVSVEDLLGRDPIRLDETLIRTSLEGRSVMVTGGGGSIGSELCRQVAAFQPTRLVIFERAESDLYRIHLELSQKFPDLEIVQQIGDIRELPSVEQAIERYDIQSIFHAAAYKHVPMMEAHLLEAVKNNVLGTRNVVQAAVRHGVSDFLMISSDKAVNPTNVMGLTKRIAELVVSSLPTPAEGAITKCVSVRFGNVLGSNGSVVPLFRQQIAAGGPVTVTHPDMRRYFMTIREAVQLVLQASTMGKGSEIFVLDMGEPVSIVSLARNMIRLSGHEPDSEIEIRFTGLRPGEKLFEELALENESHLPTYHQKIKIFRGPRQNEDAMALWIAELERMVGDGDAPAIVSHLKSLVPEYQPMGQWRKVLSGAEASAVAVDSI
jgi:FlaA1/EpsC-like NDP-sugar epimerase